MHLTKDCHLGYALLFTYLFRLHHFYWFTVSIQVMLLLMAIVKVEMYLVGYFIYIQALTMYSSLQQHFGIGIFHMLILVIKQKTTLPVPHGIIDLMVKLQTICNSAWQWIFFLVLQWTRVTWKELLECSVYVSIPGDFDLGIWDWAQKSSFLTWLQIRSFTDPHVKHWI